MTHNLSFQLDDMTPGKEEEEDMHLRVQGDGIPPQAVT